MRKRAPQQSPQERLAFAVLSLLPDVGPQGLTPQRLAAQANVTRAFAQKHYDGLASVIPILSSAFSRESDRALPKRDPSLSVAEALFEALATRIEAMEPFLTNIRALLLCARKEPRTALVLIKTVSHVMRESLAYADAARPASKTAAMLLAFLFCNALESSQSGIESTFAKLDNALKTFAKLHTLNVHTQGTGPAP